MKIQVFILSFWKKIKGSMKSRYHILTFIFFISQLFSCSTEINSDKFLIGVKINEASIINVDTTLSLDDVYRVVKIRADTSIDFYITNPDNRIFFYSKTITESADFSKYYRIFSAHFSDEPAFRDSTESTQYYLRTSHTWYDSITSDFAVLSSSKNIRDSVKKLGDSWYLEAGNDSLISKYRLIEFNDE